MTKKYVRLVLAVISLALILLAVYQFRIYRRRRQNKLYEELIPSNDRYVSVVTREGLRLHCGDCAFVTSSGVLLRSNAGAEIDSHECVIRTNNSPTKDFEKDVGSKTTVRILGFQGVKSYEEKVKRGDIVQNGSYVIGWGPPRLNGIGKPYTEKLKDLQMQYMETLFYEFTNISWAYQIFDEITNTKSDPDLVWISTGLFSMLFAQQTCDKIVVYGMTDERHCEKLAKSKGKLKDVPYHYYDAPKVKECRFVLQQERDKKGGHHFVAEKKIFRKWAVEGGDISFKHPAWEI